MKCSVKKQSFLSKVDATASIDLMQTLQLNNSLRYARQEAIPVPHGRSIAKLFASPRSGPSQVLPLGSNCIVRTGTQNKTKYQEHDNTILPSIQQHKTHLQHSRAQPSCSCQSDESNNRIPNPKVDTAKSYLVFKSRYRVNSIGACEIWLTSSQHTPAGSRY